MPERVVYLANRDQAARLLTTVAGGPFPDAAEGGLTPGRIGPGLPYGDALPVHSTESAPLPVPFAEQVQVAYEQEDEGRVFRMFSATQ